MKEFLEYLDYCERNTNSAIKDTQIKMDCYHNQRSMVQEIRTQFLKSHPENSKSKVEDRDEPWNKLITNIKQAKDLPGMQNLLGDPEKLIVYRSALDMVLDLISECVPL